MKKLLAFIFLVLIFCLGFYLYKSKSSAKNLGLSFPYPKMLTASTTKEVVILSHDIHLPHPDFCNMKDESLVYERLVDFNISIHLENLGLVDTMKTVNPYIPQENFQNNEVIESPGFIDSYKVGDLSGWKIFEGAEGCGQITYFLPVSSSKTLVVTQELIPIWSTIIDQSFAEKAKKTDGYIGTSTAESIFEQILKNISFI